MPANPDNVRRGSAIAATTLVVFSGQSALAQAISGISFVDSSSGPPTTPNATFAVSSEQGNPVLEGAIASFVQRVVARNTRSAIGGVAQINKRNVVYQLDFTVEDPANLGFRLSIESLIRGVSWISQSTGVADPAVATGLVYGVQWDDSTDAPDTYTAFGLLNDVGTTGVMVEGIGVAGELQSSLTSGTAGVFVGTTSFSFRFTTVTTPTTNVAFQNNQLGFGVVDYGIGPLPDGFESVDVNDLGHFLTIRARFLLAGDTNADGVVNFADLNDVLSAFGNTGEPDFVGADLNGDGVVNFADLNIVLSNFGASIS
jgi:hypothetical protein